MAITEISSFFNILLNLERIIDDWNTHNNHKRSTGGYRFLNSKEECYVEIFMIS